MTSLIPSLCKNELIGQLSQRNEKINNQTQFQRLSGNNPNNYEYNLDLAVLKRQIPQGNRDCKDSD